MKSVGLLMVVAAWVASGSADQTACGPLERIKVQHQWAEAYGFGRHRIQFGLRLWNRIFHDHPQARQFFRQVHGENTYSPQFQAYAQQVLGGLDMMISLLDDPATLHAQQAHFKSQLAASALGDVGPMMPYDVFIEELLDILPDYLGSHLDYGAWNHCLRLIISGVVEG